MNITRIKYFSVVAETGSVRKAAELMQLSPPALSRAIKQLEEELGVVLFVPSGRGIAITDQGRLLQQRAGRLLSEYESFVSESRRAGGASDLLRIGTFELFSTHVMGWAIAHHLAGRAVLLREVIPAELEGALLNRVIDIGITSIPVPNEALDFLKVVTQELAIYGKASVFGATAFADLPFCVPISPVFGAALPVQGLDGWPSNGPRRNVRFQFDMLETALNVAARGQGVLFCPPFVIQRYNELVRDRFQLERLPYPTGMKPAKIGVYLVKRRSTLLTRDIKLLKQAIRQCCG
ncbi:MAG TPA: LysR family transcriptional regulator [Gemmataceae bacterium]|nr:LysR family transcriptional regulator [Gemmataceae bacterium]